MSNRIIIVHGWADNPNIGWLGWLAGEMRTRGYDVKAPYFRKVPIVSADIPPILTQLRREVGILEPGDIFVTHSLGVPLTLRMLSNYTEETTIRGLVMVAGMIDYPLMRPNILFDPPINRHKIVQMVEKRIVIHSENDHVVLPRYTKELGAALGADTRLDPGKGHFTGFRGINRVDSILQAVLECALFVRP